MRATAIFTGSTDTSPLMFFEWPALCLKDLISPPADSHAASVFRTSRTVPKRAQHRARTNLGAAGSTNLSSGVAMSGGSSSIPVHTVQLEYSSAHVGAYFLMRALMFRAEVSAKFVFSMEAHEVPLADWGKCCPQAATDTDSTNVMLESWSPKSDTAHRIAGLLQVAIQLASVRDLTFGPHLIPSWGTSACRLAMQALMTEYQALRESGMTGHALDPAWVPAASIVLFQPMFYQPLEYQHEPHDSSSVAEPRVPVHGGTDKDALQRADFWKPRMIDRCLGVYVVARHIPAMRCLHRWFQTRYHGEHRLETHAGAHLTAALRRIGQVCYLLHGEVKPV